MNWELEDTSFQHKTTWLSGSMLVGGMVHKWLIFPLRFMGPNYINACPSTCMSYTFLYYVSRNQYPGTNKCANNHPYWNGYANGHLSWCCIHSKVQVQIHIEVNLFASMHSKLEGGYMSWIWELWWHTMKYDNPYAPCMVYLPTQLGDLVRANVGIHIPSPWFAYCSHIDHWLVVQYPSWKMMEFVNGVGMTSHLWKSSKPCLKPPTSQVGYLTKSHHHPHSTGYNEHNYGKSPFSTGKSPFSMGKSPFSMANIFDHLHQVLGLSGPLPGVIFNLCGS